jgi:hypothetical protein
MRPQCVRRVLEDPKCALPPELLAATSSSQMIQKALQDLAIPARPQPGQQPFPKVSADYRFADALRWQEIREDRTMVSPKEHDPQPVRPSGRTQNHAMENLLDGHKPEDYYPRRSSATSLIAQLNDLVPGCSREVTLQPLSLESRLSELETIAFLTLRNSPTETLFDNGLHGSLLTLRQLSHFIVKRVRYLYGCLHMANHIIGYGMMSTYSMNNDLKRTAVTYVRLRKRRSLVYCDCTSKRTGRKIHEFS